MAWTTTDDARTFLDVATPLLVDDPVAHAAMLTEAAYLAARPDPQARLGVLRSEDGAVVAAFVRAPRHPAVLSRLGDGADDAVLCDVARVGPLPWEVDVRDRERVAAALAAHGVATVDAGRVVAYRLADDVAPDPRALDPDGAARVAVEADRALLTRWYGTLLGGLADDATDLAFLVDDPLSYGGAVLWEHAGTPRGVAVRKRSVAGVAKVTAAWSPDDERFARAAFLAACAAARTVAATVVAVARPERVSDAWHRSVGFVPTAERVLLTAQAGRRAST